MSLVSSCLVPMARERRVEPHVPVLALLPPFGGSPGVYGDLACRIRSEYPVVGVQSHGLLVPEEPDTTVPAMAQRYATELAEAHRAQKWLLLGYSMGGLLAVEVARHLVGREACSLEVLLVDSSPTHSAFASGLPWGSLLSDVLRVDVDLSSAAGASPLEQLRRIRDAAADQGRLSRRFPLDRLERMASVCEINRTAAAEFVPSHYPRAVHSLRSTTIGPSITSMPDPWSEFAADVKLEQLVADSPGPLTAPGVECIAAKANWLLDQLRCG